MARMETPTREGPFWDVMAGRAAPPPAATTLGWELLHVDPGQGTIEVAFTAGESFTNPMGVVQGGFLAAMLDDTLGPALVATLPRRRSTCTSSSSARPAPAGWWAGAGSYGEGARCASCPANCWPPTASPSPWPPRPRTSRRSNRGDRPGATIRRARAGAFQVSRRR
jgi:hypothetical protein